MKNISLLIILLLLFDSLTNATMAQSCNKFCCGKQAVFFIKNMTEGCTLTWESSGNVNSPSSPKMGLMYGQKSAAFYPRSSIRFESMSSGVLPITLSCNGALSQGQINYFFMDKSSANSTGCVAPTEKNTVNGVKGVSKTTQQNGNAIIEFVIVGR